METLGPTDDTPPEVAAVAPVRAPRSRRRRWARGCAGLVLVLVLVCCSTSFLVSKGGQSASADCGTAATSDEVLAGSAKEDISPADEVYLGGYGIGAVRRSTGVLQPLYVRALAIRGLDGAPADTVIFAAVDSQGYFAAYQSGPYGLADVRATISRQLGVPASHILISATHSHAAPDTVGFWGGVPDSYLRLVHDQAIAALTQAVQALVPTRLRVGTASIAGYTSSFGETSRGGQGSGAPWPTDTQLRVLRAVAVGDGRTIATLVNVSVHATALGSDNAMAAPDWPGVTADDIERQLGGMALVMIGAVGHTWPGMPPGTPAPASRLEAMRVYGQVIADRAVEAAAGALPIASPTLCAADRTFREVDTSAPLLLGLQVLGRPGQERILRSLAAPYFLPPNVLGVEAQVVRIGDTLFFAAPVEPYPSLLFALRDHFHASDVYFFGLVNDDLGYACQSGEYLGAVKESPTDEGLFIVNPSFGDELVDQLVKGAEQIAGVRAR